MAMVVLHEETGHTDSPLAKDTALTALAAAEAGCEVYLFSSDYELFGTADEALEQLPEAYADGDPLPGVWLGFIPSPERYREIYDAARRRGVVLLNTPEHYQIASEFDRSYALITGLTPRSAVVTDVTGCDEVVRALGLPLFVKGAVRSIRTQGWRACVAETELELRALVGRLLAMGERSRGRVIVRTLVRFRHARTTEHGFPLGREYRVLLHETDVLGYGYYWPGADPLMALAPDEEEAVLALAREAARRVGVPLLAVDVGQLEDGSWVVVEVGDPQFAGWSEAPRRAVFEALRRRVERSH